MKSKKNNIVLEIGLITVVLGFLGWVTYNQFDLAKAKSRDVERKSELHEISKVVRLYYKDYGKLPEENLLNGLWGKEWRDGDYVYMKEIPKENYLENKEYCYQISDSGNSFMLFTDLENRRDVDCYGKSWSCENREYCYRDIFEAVEVKN